MYRLFVILLLFSISGFSQNDSISIKKNYYPSGVLSSQGNMLHGKPTGLWKNYYPNGKLKSTGTWKNNELNGTWFFFADNGDTLQVINYRNRKKNGWNYFYKKNKCSSKYLYLDGEIVSFATLFLGNKKKLVPYKKGIKSGFSYTFVGDSLTELSEYRNDYLIYTIPVNRLDKNKLKTGKWISLYDDNHLKEEQNYLRDTLNGPYKLYNRQTAVIKYIYYDMGVKLSDKKDNKTTVFKEIKYKNGQLKEKGSYLGNKPVGLHFLYDSTGNYRYSVYYDIVNHIIGKGKIDKNEARTGQWVFTDTNAVLLSKGKYKKGYRHGHWQFFYPNGNVEQEGNYKKGRFHGLWKAYYENKALFKTEEYDKGVLEGNFKQFFASGEAYVEGEYKEGEKDGKWLYSNSYLNQIKYFSMGEKTGLWISKYANGKLAYKGRFENNLENGKHIFYYSNGFTKASTYYIFGSKEKLWFYFTNEGTEIIRLLYKNNILSKIDGKKYN